MSELDDLEFDVHEFAEQLGYTDELGKHDMSGSEHRAGDDEGLAG